MLSVLNFINHINKVLALLNYLQSPLLFVARLYVAEIFFSSGLTKLTDWETTLYLFESEYAVPFLSSVAAAWLGTICEIMLPVLLTIGIFTRAAALGLFFVNIVAVISLSEIALAALYLHYLWAVLFTGIIVTGGGFFSLDRLAQKYQ